MKIKKGLVVLAGVTVTGVAAGFIVKSAMKKKAQQEDVHVVVEDEFDETIYDDLDEK